ncbi:MAG TPA: sigma-70 family RNA polymerase sigma factor, partial [Candidatus Eisenbacteria bacterium]|nr:sigma-70 family RNA polymerase sigma factor [Candidatus Eisenbacteria bacterium]
MPDAPREGARQPPDDRLGLSVAERPLESPATLPQAPAARDVEILFRRESGRIVSGLCRVFGPARLELAEDVVQETMVRALRTWRFQGMPRDPAAWLMRTARNLAVDHLRRDRWLKRREAVLEGWGLAAGASPAEGAGGARFAGEISDDQMAMVFLSCHPKIPRGSRVALTLRAAGGFTSDEIARALLTTPAAVAQGVARAKAALRRGRMAVALPGPTGLRERTDLVLDALYVMFSQGYHAQRGWDLIRRDVCDEALRLAEAVAAHPVTGGPAAHALAALFSFHAARFPARVNEAGEMVLLRDQDRSRYDRALLARGARHLDRAASGDRLTTWHLEADIASCHSLAPSFDETDWPHIVECYDRLLRLNPSPTVAVNRAVALARVRGPREAIEALERLRGWPSIRTYVPLPLALASLYEEVGRMAEARKCIREALALESSAPTRRHVRALLDSRS